MAKDDTTIDYPLYHNYMMTELLHHFGGDESQAWNKNVRDWLRAQQNKERRASRRVDYSHSPSVIFFVSFSSPRRISIVTVSPALFAAMSLVRVSKSGALLPS